MRYRALVRQRRDSRTLRVASSRCIADRSRCRMISDDCTADQSHEYLSCNDFFGQGSNMTTACSIIPRSRVTTGDRQTNREVVYNKPHLITLLLLLFAGTIVCEFLRFGKNRKIKYPQKFLPAYQAPWCIYNHKLCDDFPFWIRHNLSPLIISAFPFFLPVPSRARKSGVR